MWKILDTIKKVLFDRQMIVTCFVHLIIIL